MVYGLVEDACVCRYKPRLRSVRLGGVVKGALLLRNGNWVYVSGMTGARHVIEGNIEYGYSWLICRLDSDDAAMTYECFISLWVGKAGGELTTEGESPCPCSITSRTGQSLPTLSRVLAENETHHGDISPGWEGNTHLRMRLRSQGTDYRGSLTGRPCGFYDRGP